MAVRPEAGPVLYRVTRGLRLDPSQLPEPETWGEAMTLQLLASRTPPNCVVTPDGLVVNGWTNEVYGRVSNALPVPIDEQLRGIFGVPSPS
jgi:hypothetical protein